MQNTQKKILGFIDITYMPLVTGAAVTVASILLIYGQTQEILKERLRERIGAMASTAALQFSGEEIESIIAQEQLLHAELSEIIPSADEEFEQNSYFEKIKDNSTLQKSEILAVTQKLKNIREANVNIKYLYIWRKTSKPDTLAFVTDSDTVFPIDWNENGKIDELEYPPLPGEEYDVSEIEAVKNGAFTQTTVETEFIIDRWGTFLSGFSPIYDKNGRVAAILGMDVQIDDFNKIVRATLVPFLLLAALLLLLLTIQTFALIRIWRSRVDFVKELDRQKDELLSIVSHQLATPVTSIKWYLEMMLDGDMGKMTKEQEENVKGMQHISTNLADLVSMILDVSRIQLGRIKIEKQKLSLQEFFHEILEVIEPKAKEKKINLIKDMPAQLPDAMLDKRYTRMTVENLLSNAVKYTPAEGKVTLDIKIKGNTLYCKVSDTGLGIPKADQDKIFGKLFRASNVRNAVDGNGFGLYVAKGAVEAQGGKIWFESTEGKGTTFFIELPLS